jgi:hypothetical protein
MESLFFGLLIAIALVTAICLAVLYVLFCANPDKRWKNRVQTLVRSAEKRREEEEYQTRDAGRLRADAETHLAQAYVERAFDRVSLEELQRFHGVGPAMISTLRGAGFRRPGEVLNRQINLRGFGPAKIDLVRTAAATLFGETRTAVRRGQLPEGIDLEVELEKRRRTYKEEDARRRDRLKTLQMVLQTIEERVAIAQGVTLVRYIKDPRRSRLPQELLDQPIPDLKSALAYVNLSRERTNRPKMISAGPGPVRAPSPPPRRATGATEVPVRRVGDLTATPPPRPSAMPVKEEVSAAEPMVLSARVRHLETLEIPPSSALTAALVRERYLELSERIDLEEVRSQGNDAVRSAAARLSNLYDAAESLLTGFGESLDD